MFYTETNFPKSTLISSFVSYFGAACWFSSFWVIYANQFIYFSSRLIELGCPWNRIFPNLSTRHTKGIPLIEKSLMSWWSPFQPFKVRCWILVHPLELILWINLALSSSTLTATILTFFYQAASFFSSISWLCCMGLWHGPHQVAQTSSSKTYPSSCLKWVFPSVNTLSIYP